MAKMKVYSTPTCSVCIQTKKFLHEKKIKFQDINVAEDQNAFQEMVEKSGQVAVPIIDIDGKIITSLSKLQEHIVN